MTAPFAAIRLCLTVASNCLTAGDDWQSLLMNPALRLATSTPVSAPSGDYTWRLFDTLDQRQPGLGATLKSCVGSSISRYCRSLMIYNTVACYALAQCTAQAKPLADFLLSPAVQGILVDAGFGGAKPGR